ncbi:MAG TPA: 4'-phosphopantetheinyl transferase superfamily protein [Streptosporangiaceae bacterium]
MLEQILPPWVAAVEAFGDVPGATLFPEEAAVVARAVSQRRTEFASARACARAALARLGEPPAPILPGARGAPQWPVGLAGSITHCDGYRAAAVARTADVATLGLDAEPNEALPHGVYDIIALANEQARIADLAAAASPVCWDRLLFCVKEAVYKAWFPVAQRWLDFHEADITINAAAIDAEHGTFSARLLVPGPLVAGSPLTELRGRWLAARGLLLTAIVVPARPQPAGFPGLSENARRIRAWN